MYDEYSDQYDTFEDYGPPDVHTDSYERFRQVPEVVRKFLIYFRNCINEGMIFEIQNLYENTFPKISEQLFEKQSWPDESEIAHIVENDTVFLILYKELYYRHIYARMQGPTLEQRFGSFYNYCDLFNYILNPDEPVQLELPDQWLWELIDEFVYQFQSFSHYRANLTNKTPEEIENLSNHNKVWDILCILNVLHYLVDKSKIKSQLEIYASGGDPDSVAGPFGKHSLYKMLGYFALIGLLRVHSLLGDYYQAIKVLENVEIYKKSAYSHVPGCQISTAYYVGFAYMMMRRYADAIRTFSGILLYIQRTKQLFTTRSYQNDQINKQTEQMYHLLAICLVLHPQCIDEGLQQALRERNYHEKMYKMQYGDIVEFESCFLFACPKFFSSTPPSPDSTREDYTKDAIKHQTQVFMDEVIQQKMLPTIRSYLKLYTTLPLSKLATFMYRSNSSSTDENWDLDKEVAALTIHLLCFKHKMKNIVWTKGASGLDGKFQSGSELDFYIDHDMIHIADTKVAHRYGDFFIRKILKFEELNRKLHHIKI
ncbi:GSCOCG00005553001-RA-CDS [Cotesia congregata]|uniref:Eukaryotic translation initiation factor 3 subunit L n=1 Tax=Cotesia congregata TaxID=51543 RepID=A0A8J2MIH3_COTCN|nr:GSCOCG00005553001-RA-CDS [Cotesia congregata]CAG5093494.1 Similar to AAEL009617: Eukaryotic translation initiation factor 3 subunit L (Aedes aegypti) [Cotesia congregata]